MNEKAEAVEKFIEENPQFRGKFVGWTFSDGLGITRIDDRWFECDEYLIELSDLKEVLGIE
jgi:hypothetical protein